MLKVNLEKETLNRAAQTKVILAGGNDAISEVRGLLEYGSLEDSFIVNNLGINSLNAKLQEDKGKLIVMERIERFSNLTVVRIEDIKILAEKYRLRFLETKRYAGIIPSDIASNIKDLEKRVSQNNPKFLKFDAHQLQTDFFVLAPEEMFKLDEREKTEGTIQRMNRRFRNFTEAMKSDPIMFYKEDSEHYIMVRKWGNDFTIFRRALGIITYNQLNLFSTFITSLLFILGAVSRFNVQTNDLIMGLIAGVIVSSIITVSLHDNFFTKNNWKSPIR